MADKTGIGTANLGRLGYFIIYRCTPANPNPILAEVQINPFYFSSDLVPLPFLSVKLGLT